MSNDSRPICMRRACALLIAVVLGTATCGDEEGPAEPPPQVPSSVIVSPATTTMRAFDETVQLTAAVRDQNGRAISNATVNWASGDPSVATVSASGLVTATGNGGTRVTASAGTATGTAEVTVQQQVSSVLVSPPNASVAEGDTLRLRAETRDARDNEVAGTSVVWTSANASVATVDSTGLVHARARGTARISATAETISGTAEITVSLPRVPPNPAVDAGTSHTLQTTGMRIPHGTIRRGREGTSQTVVYADFDADGDTDLFYAPLNRTPNLLPPEVYLNDGNSGFVFASGFFGNDPPATVHARKALPGDFNGDGRPDVFVLAHGYDREPFPGESNYVLLSSDEGYVQGSGLDSIVAFHHGGASADVDADGDLDVFVTEGPYFLINDGTGSFRRDTTRLEGIGRQGGIYTAELVDVDRDGYVDILAGALSANAA